MLHGNRRLQGVEVNLLNSLLVYWENKTFWLFCSYKWLCGILSGFFFPKKILEPFPCSTHVSEEKFANNIVFNNFTQSLF